MDLLIRGMEIPKSCIECPFVFSYTESKRRAWYLRCPFANMKDGLHVIPSVKGQRSENCPLIALPSHGDLIEADGLRELAYERGAKHGCVAFVDALDITLAPVIIPADKEEESSGKTD